MTNFVRQIYKLKTIDVFKYVWRCVILYTLDARQLFLIDHFRDSFRIVITKQCSPTTLF